MRYLNRPPFLTLHQAFVADKEMEISFHLSSDEECTCHPESCQCWVAQYMNDPNNICGVDCWEDVVEFHERASKEWRKQPLPPDRPWIAEWGNHITLETCCKPGPIEPPIGPCLGCGRMFSGGYGFFGGDVFTFGASGGYVMCRYCMINNQAHPVGVKRMSRYDSWPTQEGDYPAGHWVTFLEWCRQLGELVDYSLVDLTIQDYFDFWSERKTPEYVAKMVLGPRLYRLMTGVKV